ncbi:MAG: carboxypeptidase regulatory-like domain-containing protein [Flavobacteriales bacterium]|nr:carboxypeptidase regulatory-like domain-containing protein [Flavobacteriales bacterium]MCB9363969.1 carboxypeptidase regulatory-like domain-containing protein [Flavobacteriales bacterium]
MLKRLAFFMFAMMVVFIANAQSGGTIRGTMTDKVTGEPLPFANVVVFKGGAQVAGTMTDFDGKYSISALTPGSYVIQASYVGYQPIKLEGVVVNDGKITFADVKAGQGIDMDVFEVVEYEVPLISKDQTSSGGTVTRESIDKMPGRSASDIAATVGGVQVNDDGSYNIRGSRSNSTDTYIDGIRVRGSANLPKSAIEQVNVIVGGLPAEYGDATGGVVSITTRGASKDWFGGLEYVTSGFKNGDDVVGLDKFGFNLLGFNLAGPILTKKNDKGEKTDALAGFFISGELKHEVDPNPTSIDNYRINADVFDELNTTPYSRNLEGGGVVNNASFINSNDMEVIKFRQNVARKGLNLAGKIDISPSKNTTVTFGGTFDYRNRNGYVRSYALFNPQNNPQVIDRQWRAYGRVTQRFENNDSEESSSLIKNAFVSLQADYSNTYQVIQDEDHKAQLSNYGYIGKFTSTRQNLYNFENFTPQDANGNNLTGAGGQDSVLFAELSSTSTVLYEFEAGDINPVLANYTQSYYDAYANDPIGHWERLSDVTGGGGLINGSTAAPNVYNLWSSMGGQYDNYNATSTDQLRITTSGSAEIKGHAIKLGFQYEQRSTSNYTINPGSLWNIGRGLVNAHINNRDFREGTYTESNSNLIINGDTIPRFTFVNYYGDNQTQFDKNIREKLGLAQKGTDYIDFDSYGSDLWDASDFTPDDLFNNYSQNEINYYGYDYTGKKLSGNPSLDNFFNKKDENGNFTREIGAFKPIYMAGYIQDKFAFEDLIFNIGVRVDRYDANQPVLKDKYSLFPVKTVAEVGEISGKPSNIGDDFVVYVSDAGDPNVNNIVGYRDGDVWYSADGKELTDPSVLHSSGTPNPWLVDPNDEAAYTDLNAQSFKDYEPVINVSPRIAFSFPISDEALFFAHYDVLTQRPSSNSSLQLIDYLLIQQTSNRINNPDLKAEKTVDFELGFQQKIDNYSALKIAAFYRELKDMVQVVRVIGAYPESYMSYGNKDFGTVKGMTFSYDLRRKGNVSLRAAYTLQFADGTGSSTTSSLNLVSSGNGNLRTLLPLSFDQRHAIVLSADYRYGSGKSYNGPKVFGKDIFSNTGLNVVFRTNSGTPYTKTSRIVNSAVISGTYNSPIESSLNGNRLPWTRTVDLKLDKNIDLKWGKGEGEERTKAYLNVYLQILNVLDTKNILNVYSATGNADDDGFLAAAEWQGLINNNLDVAAYRDLYSAKVADPSNYSLPRRFRLGVQLNF